MDKITREMFYLISKRIKTLQDKQGILVDAVEKIIQDIDELFHRMKELEQDNNRGGC